MKIVMIGTGYVGLVSGTCFAEMGFDVTCVDIDAAKIAKLRDKGEIPIFEPGLAELVTKNAKADRLHFTTDLSTCVPAADAVFIAVGTPQDEDGSADMRYVLQAARDVAAHVQGYTVIVDKSTVPVGTAKRVHSVMAEVNPTAAFDVVSNPEFLREGAALSDFMNPDRVVVGVSTPAAERVMRALYKPLTDASVPLVVTTPESAELIKYAANAFLATKITFINEIAQLCEVVGADVTDVVRGIGSDSRIGNKFLQPGPGYGGSCFPKDTHAIVKTAQDAGVSLSIIETTIAANQRLKEAAARKIIEAMGGSVAGKKLAVLGLAFKANTDDMRDAPALTVVPALQAAGASLAAFDPEAAEQASRLLPSLSQVSSAEEALAGADGAVILTDWPEFRNLNLNALAQQLGDKVLVDLRNMYDCEAAKVAGLRYVSIGRV